MRLLCLLPVLALAGCDSFFTVCGHVTRCPDGKPLVGVRVRTELVRGVSSLEVDTSFSDPDGRYCTTLNEPESASARLSFDKPGYAVVAREFSQAPEGDQDVCLDLAP
ncbi:MAG: hypothetical protein ACYC8T_14900 [Myxococcaceae bacterium]